MSKNFWCTNKHLRRLHWFMSCRNGCSQELLRGFLLLLFCYHLVLLLALLYLFPRDGKICYLPLHSVIFYSIYSCFIESGYSLLMMTALEYVIQRRLTLSIFENSSGLKTWIALRLQQPFLFCSR